MKSNGPLYTRLLNKLSTFNKGNDLCSILEAEYQGRLPLKIWAARENEFYGSENILVRAESTDKRFVFLPDLLAPSIIRAIWYPSTVASLAAKYANSLEQVLSETSDVEVGFSRFMIYGFGHRSASSHESSILGGAAFLQFFEYTDIVEAQDWLHEIYSAPKNKKKLTVFSLDHSRYLLLEKTISENPKAFLQSVFNQFDTLSIPMDTTSFSETEKTLRELVQHVPAEKTLILRWDNSSLEKALPSLLEILKTAGPLQKNIKGYSTWNRNLYLMFTEDITLERMNIVLRTTAQLGFSVDRLLFGVGTNMLQKVSRNDYGVVGKITAAHDGEQWFDVEKTSLEQPEKRGLAGRLSLVKEEDQWRNARTESSDAFQLVYDGSL